MTSNRPPAFFVGEHLALDFLNTTATPQGTQVDWLGDGKDLVDWLEQAGSIEPAAAARIRDSGSDAIDEVARQAREFRRWLRGFVTARMGEPLRATAAVAPLNELLARDSSFQRVEVAGRDADDGRRPLLRRVRRWESSEELLEPIAEAAADLICHRDFRLIRSCGGFGLHAGVPRSHEGPHPALVQHGGLRQPGQGGSAPGQKGRGMKKGVVTPVSVREADLEPERA